MKCGKMWKMKVFSDLAMDHVERVIEMKVFNDQK
jgi:hypothetical protein